VSASTLGTVALSGVLEICADHRKGAMVTRQPTRKHLTFSDLLKRWKCTEKELRSAIIRAELKPSVKLYDKQPLLIWKVDINGIPAAFECDFYREPKPQQWLYLQDPIQTAAFECEFALVTDDRDPIKDEAPISNWLRLPVPMSMEDVKSKAVFLLAEVERFEKNHFAKASGELTDRPLGKRERGTLLKIILGMARGG
jgi:hypothetical protein